MIALLALAAAAGSPQPGELKTFKDWIVGCDNGRACQANALLPTGEVEGATMTVERGAEARAVPKISIMSDMNAAGLAIDDARSAFKLVPRDGYYVLAPGDAMAFTVPLAKAGKLTLIDAQGKALVTISLSGASAALRYIDDRQKRLGTVTALVARGPVKTVPPPPALPVVTMPAASAAAPAKFRSADTLKFAGDRDCGVDPANFKTEAFRLDATHTLVLVPSLCGNGAYNYYTTALIAPNTGRPLALAKFDADGGMGEPGNTDPSLVNAGYDPKTRRLSTYAKGRGLGDCGTMQDYVWDGARFRLELQEQMGECRGSVDYIPTWRATVR